MKIDDYSVCYEINRSVLSLRVRCGEFRTSLSTGIRIDADKFIDGRCRRNTTHGRRSVPAAMINRRLDELEEKIAGYFRECSVSGRVPDREGLRAAFGRSSGSSGSSSFRSAYLTYIREESKARQWTPNTLKSADCVMKLFLKFMPDASFGSINASTIEDFAVWQQTNRLSARHLKSGEKGYANNVIRKNCSVFRWFVAWAVEKGYLDREILRARTPKIKTKAKKIVYLTGQEIHALESLPAEAGSDIRMAVDFFLFCCYSGLRFSDASALCERNISSDRISLTIKKTGKDVSVELNRHTRAILDRYRGRYGARALPVFTNSRLNDLLKEAGKMAGISSPVTVSQYYGGEIKEITLPKYEFLTSHCARRTFITLALSMGIPPNVVMKWTGHSEYSAMKPYIDIVDEEKKRNMKLFDGV